ncbi:MAG: OmpA family protein [Cyclobacteriaceae bacterium]|nr:OmpA family protein [Cyclobacteriaceae bacterium]UYN86125.1 MAG: OmpA family protein [Cyclobacteriaceae bacterium]
MRIGLLIIILLRSILAVGQHEDELRKSIYFGGGSYYVDEFQAEDLFHWLDSIPNLLDKYEIHLISHTDPIGGRQYNEWLSKMRSQAVQELLLLRDIPEHKISVKDWGLDNPVFRNDTRKGMSLNRRVDVILYPIIF